MMSNNKEKCKFTTHIWGCVFLTAQCTRPKYFGTPTVTGCRSSCHSLLVGGPLPNFLALRGNTPVDSGPRVECVRDDGGPVDALRTSPDCRERRPSLEAEVVMSSWHATYRRTWQTAATRCRSSTETETTISIRKHDKMYKNKKKQTNEKRVELKKKKNNERTRFFFLYI